MPRKHKLRRDDIKWREDPVTHVVTAEVSNDFTRARQRGINVVENWLMSLAPGLNRDQLIIELIMVLEGKVTHTDVVPTGEAA